MSDFFSFKRVIHQTSCVDRPQQNFILERKHQHLLNVVRAIRFYSNLCHDPILTFWIYFFFGYSARKLRRPENRPKSPKRVKFANPRPRLKNEGILSS